MQKAHFSGFDYYSFTSFSDLTSDDQSLCNEAILGLPFAYAPYSHFHVCCSLRFNDGSILRGTNQENASYPNGSCAEQVVLKYAIAAHPHKIIDTIAITTQPLTTASMGIASPCGMCRQTILEYELRQKYPIRIILFRPQGDGFILSNIKHLLPFHFSPEYL